MKIIRVEDDDLLAIEGRRCRTFRAVEQPLKANIIWEDIQQQQRKRVIIICNTVSHAQGLYRSLKKLDSSKKLAITLLHARFLPGDRAEKESQLQEAFKRDWVNDGICRVLISTQVIEAGINITCEVMHVQICPMNSLLQRAGRCARFQDEVGEVLVYPSIDIDSDDLAIADQDLELELEPSEPQNLKTKNYLPYTKELAQACEHTWKVLQEHTQSQQVSYHVNFRLEEEWINRVHTEVDRLQMERRQNNKGIFHEKFNRAIFTGDRSVASDLIRDVDSRSIFVWEESALIDFDIPEIDPKNLQAFSVPTSTLLNVWRDKQKLEYEIDWLFRRIEEPDLKRAESYTMPNWSEIESQTDLVNSIRILVNPKYVSYSREIGLVISIKEEDHHDGDRYLSPPAEQKLKGSEYQYHMDSYVAHLNAIWSRWLHPFKTERIKNGQRSEVKYSGGRDELLQQAGRFIQTKIFPKASLSDAEALFEYLVFFAVFTHDLGKLQISWQQAVRGWQKIAYQNLGGRNPKNDLLAHTDYHPSKKDAQGKTQAQWLTEYEKADKRHKRPPHAVESAYIGQAVLNQSLKPLLEDHFDADADQIQHIRSAVMMAAGRHHVAWASGDTLPKVIQLHPQAQEAIDQSWQSLVLKNRLPNIFPLQPVTLARLEYKGIQNFNLNRFVEDQVPYLQLYWLITRALRLCDQRSVQR